MLLVSLLGLRLAQHHLRLRICFSAVYRCGISYSHFPAIITTRIRQLLLGQSPYISLPFVDLWGYGLSCQCPDGLCNKPIGVLKLSWSPKFLFLESPVSYERLMTSLGAAMRHGEPRRVSPDSCLIYRLLLTSIFACRCPIYYLHKLFEFLLGQGKRFFSRGLGKAIPYARFPLPRTDRTTKHEPPRRQRQWRRCLPRG